MKRMTSNEYNPCFNCNFYSSCSHIRENFPVCPERARYDRLAVYEDTGLEPEEIELLAKQRDLYVDACGELPLKRIRELAQADTEGRCVVLPCKVGDTVYQVDDTRVYALEVRNLIYDAGILAFDESTIGKTVFLTRAEAEAALRREQE